MPETNPSLCPLYVVAGPTASGKTALAIRLAQKLAGTVINMDSMQLYRELPILTAQPDADERAQAPHLLYGVRTAVEPANAAWWADRAKNAIADVVSQGRVPILCGGTGLYLQTLLEGIAPIPPVSADVRAAGAAIAAQQGGAAVLHAQLDPAMQARLAPGDTQRVVRAWEVLTATGRSLADWQAEPRQGGIWGTLQGYDARVIALQPPRAVLYERCDSRLITMLNAGALDEVQAVMNRGLPADLPLLKACGYPELAAYLRGELPRDLAIASAQQATRNYAKRQTTWFTNQLSRYNPSYYHGFGHEAAALTDSGL